MLQQTNFSFNCFKANFSHKKGKSNLTIDCYKIRHVTATPGFHSSSRQTQQQQQQQQKQQQSHHKLDLVTLHTKSSKHKLWQGISLSIRVHITLN